jgi:hypothetical protein
MDDRLPRADGTALLEEAFGSPEAVPPVLERLALDDWLSEIPEAPAYSRVDDWLAVTDMGLLEGMAGAVPSLDAWPKSLEVLPAVAIADRGAREASGKRRLLAVGCRPALAMSRGLSTEARRGPFSPPSSCLHRM